MATTLFEDVITSYSTAIQGLSTVENDSLCMDIF
jgi:hypothetical protein